MLFILEEVWSVERGCPSLCISSEKTLNTSSGCVQPLQDCMLPAQPHQVRLWKDMGLVGPGVAQVNGMSPPTCSAVF